MQWRRFSCPLPGALKPLQTERFAFRVALFGSAQMLYNRPRQALLQQQPRYAENTGAAFSFLADADPTWRVPFFLIVSAIAMGAILWYYRNSKPEHFVFRCSLALVFGGAIGNLIDRARLGYVIDFISWHWYDKAAWPTFNIADSGISVGVVLLLIVSFKLEQEDTDKITVDIK